MNESNAQSVLGNRLGAVITAVAIMISLFVMAVLVVAIGYSRQKVFESRILASLVPAAGKLLGQNADGGSEWVVADDERRMLVLFGVTETGRAGDAKFWRDVAARSLGAAPDVQFVGLCIAGATCSPPAGGEALFTLLKLMDPVQTHALTVAAREDRAFVFRGNKPAGAVSVQANPEALAAQIATIVNQRAKEDGA